MKMKMKEMKNKENERKYGINSWKQHIRDVHNDMADDIEYLFPNNSTEAFMTSIWKTSVDELDGIEVMVIIDDKDDLYISSGTSSLVSFINHEDELTNGNKMQLPIKCCIHTHPSGRAYFSERDWMTINAWKSAMNSCIVLGHNEYLAYNVKSKLAKMVYYGILNHNLGGDE